MKMSLRGFAVAAFVAGATLTPVAARAQATTLTPDQQALHEIYKELIETNTEDSAGVGSVTKGPSRLRRAFVRRDIRSRTFICSAPPRTSTR
jgi:hypothetical protein